MKNKDELIIVRVLWMKFEVRMNFVFKNPGKQTKILLGMILLFIIMVLVIFKY